MASAYKSGVTVHFLKETGQIIRLMAMERIFGTMGVSMKGISWKVTCMVKVNISIMMAVFIMGAL